MSKDATTPYGERFNDEERKAIQRAALQLADKTGLPVSAAAFIRKASLKYAAELGCKPLVRGSTKRKRNA